MLKKILQPGTGLMIAVLFGLLRAFYANPAIDQAALVISDIFISLLKLVSLPIIFLSIVSTASGMASVDEIKVLGKKVFKYTLITTLVAATVALGLFVAIDPVRGQLIAGGIETAEMPKEGYLHFLLQAIPSNIIQPFSENNVIGVLFLAMLFSLAALSLPDDKRQVIHTFFSALYNVIMKVTTWIVKLMPIAIFAFVTLFIKDLHGGLEVKNLALYLTCVVVANLIQAVIVLPSLLKAKNVSPIRLFRSMWPALSVAFFSKSSSGALPMAMQCAENRAGVSPKVASFSLPLCTTINMNACAAFILTTVLFVSMSYGMTYTWFELISWIAIATIAAIGNAGVPMGCYFLSSALLASMNVPLNILGVILPFYSLIDMLESAINVWSDSCVTAVVHQEIKEEQEVFEVA